jgi:septal ring factor EnvC (AmiA/AmiB activator)
MELQYRDVQARLSKAEDDLASYESGVGDSAAARGELSAAVNALHTDIAQLEAMLAEVGDATSVWRE